MKALTIKNIPDDLYQRLKESAQSNHRSISEEVITILQRAYPPKPLDVEELLEEPHQIHQLTIGNPVTADEIEEAINEGRS